MNKKFKKRQIKVITPLKKRCDCGRRITDHHWLCNVCHAKKQQNDYYKKYRRNNGKHNTNEELLQEC